VLGFSKKRCVIINACPELCTPTHLIAWLGRRLLV